MWVTIVTVWILLSTVIRAAVVAVSNDTNNANKAGRVIGTILHGVGIIFCLYMAGLYN